MRYCENCELSFSSYVGTTKRNILIVVVLLIFVIATVIVALTAGGSGAALEPEAEVIEPTIKIKPGDPIAPRNSEVKLGDDYVVIGYNEKDE